MISTCIDSFRPDGYRRDGESVPSHGYETATRLPGTAAIGVNKPDVGQDRHRHIRVQADIKNRCASAFVSRSSQLNLEPLLGAAGAAAVALLSRYSNPSRRHTTPRKTCDIMINGSPGPSLAVAFFAAPDSSSAHVSHALD